MPDDSPFARRPGADSNAEPYGPIEPQPIDLFEREPVDVTPGTEPLPAEERSRGISRRRKIVLGGMLAVGVLGAAVLGGMVMRISQQKDTTLSTPDTVAGLTRDDSQSARSTADYLRTAFAARISLDESIGAVYGDPAAADRSVLLFGGTTLLWSPERDLDSMFELVADDTGAVTGLGEVEAGRLGGVMKCGESRSPDGDITVCGWADHGSVVLGLFPGRGVQESAALLRDVRAGVQTRN